MRFVDEDGKEVPFVFNRPAGVRPPGAGTPPIKKIRESHHLLARCVAQGWSLEKISEVTGYSYSRISILKGDPTFAELVASYVDHVKELRNEVQRDHYARMCALHGDIVEEIHDRILDDPEMIGFDSMLDAAKFTADRIGLGPTHKSMNTNVVVNLADRVAAGRLRALRTLADPLGEMEGPPANRQLTGPSAGSPGSPRGQQLPVDDDE